jgi:transcription initiation factor TFIIIB Brf1 subunit/transcription initiation factor TFIIB
MHQKQAFKIGFLARCIEGGLSPEATRTLVKSAAEHFGKSSGVVREAVDLVKSLGPAALVAGAAPIALGGGAAYFANKATDTDATDVEEVKQKELVDTYRRMADQLQRQRKLRSYKADRKRTGQVFL